eukprot:m.265610 g.265610  ORF g.265610 m.265610 type:complete len:639 (-) comp11063_c0_seq1:1549-3465(-)
MAAAADPNQRRPRRANSGQRHDAILAAILACDSDEASSDDDVEVLEAEDPDFVAVTYGGDSDSPGDGDDEEVEFLGASDPTGPERRAPKRARTARTQRGAPKGRHFADFNIPSPLAAVDSVPIEQCTANPGPKLPAGTEMTPFGIWSLFMPSAAIRRMSQATNDHAVAHDEALGEINSSFCVDVGRIYGYLAVCYAMGITELPNERAYWSKSPVLATDYVRQIMTYDEFREIKAHFSVCTRYDIEAARGAGSRIPKVQAFVDFVEPLLRRFYVPQRDLGFDESQIQCGHRYAVISHRDSKAKKPLSTFINVYALHEAGTGYCVASRLDTRDGTRIEDCVLDVLGRLESSYHHVVMDRFYTSVELFRRLFRDQKQYAYGTIRKDRGFPPEFLARFSKDVTTKGEYDCIYSKLESPMVAPGEDEDADEEEEEEALAPSALIQATAWIDTAQTPVLFLSTCHGDTPQALRRRVKGQAPTMRKAPPVAVDYNQIMGAVDQSNSLRTRYNLARVHHRRWYLPVVYYHLELAMINACVVFNVGRSKKDKMSHLNFRMAVIEALADRAKATKRRRSSSQSSATNDVAEQRRYEHAQHLPVNVGSDRRADCVYCPTRHRTAFICSHCQVHLCVKADRNCFYDWHTK